MRDSGDLLRPVLEHVPVILWAIDAEGQVLFCQGAGLNALDLLPAKVVGHSAFQVCHQWPDALLFLREALLGRTVSRVLKLGDHLFQASAEPLVDETGKLVGVVGASTEVTELEHDQLSLRMTNEALELAVASRTSELLASHGQLRASEQRWATLLESLPDAALEITPEGVITFVNHTALRPDLTPEQVTGQSVYSFVHTHDHELVRAAMASVFERGQRQQVLVSGPNGRGGDIWYSCHLAPLASGTVLPSGPVIHKAMVVCRDVTAQRLAEEELAALHSQLLHAERLSTLGELSATVTHDLKQPLAALQTYIDRSLRLLETCPTTCLDTIRQGLQAAQEECKRAGDLISRWRRYLRRNEADASLQSLNRIAEDAWRLVQCCAHEHEVVCRWRLAESLPLLLLDDVQFVQVIVNLLMNSVEAMAGTSEEERVIVVKTESDSQSVSLSIQDCGPGIPPQRIESIWKPFTTTKSEGLGLGLAIAKSVVEAHGGRIWCESQEGAGTCFHLSLPIT